MLNVLSYGVGTIIGFVLVGGLIVLILHDVTQKKHTVLRNYPVIGRFRFFFENLGEYFRQYFFSGDRDEMPFNRATRAFIYRLAKDEGSVIGFGSTNDIREPGSILFVNHPFPVLEEDRLPTPSLVMGEGYCKHPFGHGWDHGVRVDLAMRMMQRHADLRSPILERQDIPNVRQCAEKAGPSGPHFDQQGDVL